MEKVVAGASTVNGQAGVDPRTIDIPGSDTQKVWTKTGPNSAEWLPRGHFLTYGDAIDGMLALENEHPGWMSKVYKDVNDINRRQPPPPGFKWIQEVAFHQSYPWFWNLVPVSGWQGDAPEVPAPRFNRYVQDLDQDGVPDVLEQRRHRYGKRKHFFFS